MADDCEDPILIIIHNLIKHARGSYNKWKCSYRASLCPTLDCVDRFKLPMSLMNGFVDTISFGYRVNINSPYALMLRESSNGHNIYLIEYTVLTSDKHKINKFAEYDISDPKTTMEVLINEINDSIDNIKENEKKRKKLV